MNNIAADIQQLIADFEAKIVELEAAGKKEAAAVLRYLVSHFNTVLAELKKLLGL